MDAAEHPLIRKLDSIADLEATDREALRALPLTIRDIKADQDIVREGDRPFQSCLVLDGFTSRYKLLPDGRRQIVAFSVPGDIPDLHSLHLNVMDNSLGTITPCRLAFIQHDDLRALCDHRPRIAAVLWRDTLIQAAIFMEWVLGTGRRSARERTAHLLCEMLLRLDAVGLAGKLHFTLPFTQAEMADALGLTPVSVNRMLMELRAEGLISVERRAVTILDWQRLKAAGHFNPAYLHLKRKLGDALPE